MRSGKTLGLLASLALILSLFSIGYAQETTPEVTEEPTLEPTVIPPEETLEVTPEVTPETTVELTPEVTDAVTPPAPTATPPLVMGPQPNTVTGNVLVTETRPFSLDLMNQLILPPGFAINVFATDLGNARMIAVSAAGVVYVSRPLTNDVVALWDGNSDGAADSGAVVVATDIKMAHGLAIRDNVLYIAGEKEIYAADILDDGMLGTPRIISEGLPDGDQHGRRTIAFGPDGEMYVNLGSSCNACIESNPENATISRVPLDGSPRSIFVSGVRNTLGFTWDPATGMMWGFDHGSDFRGDDDPPEELNLLVEGNHYGWPFCYGNQIADLFIPYSTEGLYGVPNQEFCTTQTVSPSFSYQAHSAPIQMLFYQGTQFPAEYQGDAFVTMRGSWNRFPATGYKVVRVSFENGQPVSVDDFVSGWLIENGAAHFARIAGLTTTIDGSLLISDDTNGILYRVSYTGG